MPIQFSKTQQDYYALNGGLDLVTPAIAIEPGKIIDSQNYEPAIGGGYRRPDGYERFDGQASPTAANYTIVKTALTPLLIKNSANFTRSSVATYYDYAGFLKTAGINVPRISYDPANLTATPQLLLEGVVTNLVTYSEQLDNAIWNKFAVTVTPNATISPDGTLTADKVIETAVNSDHAINYPPCPIVVSTTVTGSVCVKIGERSQTQVRITNGTGTFGTCFANVDLTNGSILLSGTVGSATIINTLVTPVGYGCYRISITGTFSPLTVSVDLSTYIYNGGTSYLGDGISGIYVWGAQIENGSLTSYIQSIATPTTRSADVPAGMTVASTSNIKYYPYDATKPYSIGEYASLNGEIYQSLSNTNLNNAPSISSPYWIDIGILTPSIGNTVLGVKSGATGVIVGVDIGYLVCARVSGNFTIGESITVAPLKIGIISAAQLLNGATTTSDHADYKLLSANDQRQFIQKVPGTGQIRGVWVFNDIVYAFRDNAAGTAGVIYKSSGSGWVQVSFGFEVQFTNAVGQVFVGDTVTEGGVSGVVVAALLRSGTWTSAGVGTLIFASITGGAFSAGALQVSAVTKVTAAGASSAITRLPGGRGEFFNYNFTGSTNTTKMYGADGVNLAFEFDGTTYVPIRTGMAIDTPTHVIAHKGYLFLSFLASVQFPGLGNPYGWSVTLGAGELDCSKVVSGFLPQGGDVNGSSLAIFTAERTFVLYGSTSLDFKLVSSIFDIGYIPYTNQQVSNNAYGMTSRGIQALLTTLNYGDFDYSSISHMIQPLVTSKRGLECASNTLRVKNQYRVYFTDGTSLAVGITGDKVSGITLLNYSRPVRCIVSATLTTGQEVTYFGSDDGYIYQDNLGTSQDGNPIEAWCRLPFNNNKSPRIRKRFRRVIFEAAVDGFTKVNISYDLGYGNPNVNPSAPISDMSLTGVGNYWDQFTWDQFTWDTQTISNPTLSIDGTEKNISFLIYSNRAQDQAHTLQGLTLISSPRLLER